MSITKPFERISGRLSHQKIVRIVLALFAVSCLARIGKDDNHPEPSNSSVALGYRNTSLDGEESMEENVSQWHSEFPEKVVPLSRRKSDDQIRYAAFGSSMTWGATLEDRGKDAYVKKLSIDKGTNYGIRSSGPNYPAACTKSIVGDEEFDVIVLEFFTVANTGGMELATRLRERFPDAIIVIARLWDPPMLENKDGEGLRSWAEKKRFGQGYIHDSNFKEEFYRSFDENQWHWIFQTTHKHFVDYHEKLARETGAYIVPMAWDQHAAGENGFLEIGDKMLGPDSYHLSKLGHEDFARRVKALVDRVGVPKSPTIGEFSSTDYCLNWFQTGVIEGKSLNYSDNAVVRKMPKTEKYALVFEGGEANWIEMANPSSELMHIFVAYMTTGPPPSKYPKTEAIREENGTKIVLDPVASWGKDQKMKVHVSQLVNVGEVQPGKTARISFRPLEETEWPFRIVQIVLTAKADFGTTYGPMPDSGRIRGTIDPK